jgi:glutamine synthetase
MTTVIPVPPSLDEGSFEDGFGFDASSLRGWASIHESDMLLIPDASRVFMDPFAEENTLVVIANAVDPITKQGYGLGLYTSRRIIEAHKGRIGIVSQPGRGCRFFFELPAIAPHHMQR